MWKGVPADEDQNQGKSEVAEDQLVDRPEPQGRFHLLLRLGAEGHFSKIAFGGGVGVLGIDLEADSLNLRRRLAKCLLKIRNHIPGFGEPFAGLRRTRFADDRIDMHKPIGGITVAESLGRSRVPNVGQDAMIGKQHQNLGCLIIGGVVAEIAPGRQLGHFPPPRQEWRLIGIHVQAALDPEGRVHALESDARLSSAGTGIDIGVTVIYFDAPIRRDAALTRALGTEYDKRQLGAESCPHESRREQTPDQP
jgi:hypothetical protein